MRRPLLTPGQRALLLSLCTAAWGLAVAAATYDFWLKRAPADQLPGYMAKEHLDAHASFRFFFALVILPLVASYAMRPLVVLLSRADARAWARNATIVSLLASCWYIALARSGFLWTAVPSLVGAIIFMLLRRVDLRFTRRDIVLVPVYATVFLAIIDCTEQPVEHVMIIAAAVVLAARIGVVFIRRDVAIPPAYAFAASPLALVLQTHFLARDERYAGWPALVVALVTPFLLRALMRNTTPNRRRVRAFVTLAVFPIATIAYANAVSLYTAEGRQRVDLFEDSHHLTPGWMVAHGATPYRDIVPMHGLIDDALLDAALLRWGKPQVGNVLKSRANIALCLGAAVYFVTFAATGSAEAGILAVFATIAMGFNIGSVRFVPTLVVLAIAIFAVRKRSTRALAWAGGVAVVAGLTALDAGFYSAVITLAAMLLVARPSLVWGGLQSAPRVGDEERGLKSAPHQVGWRPLRSAFTSVVIGVSIVFGIALIGMTIGGFVVDFFRVTLTEVANLGPIYALRPLGGVPPAFDRQFPEVLTAILDTRGVQYLAWLFAMIFVAIFLAYGVRGTDRAKRRVDALFLCMLFIVVHGVSYAERQHIYFEFVIPATIVVAAYILLRRRNSAARLFGVFLAIVIVVLANVTVHAAIDTYLRRTRDVLDPAWTVVGLPAAQNALFRSEDIQMIDSVNRWCLAHMAPDDTFYDFTDHTILHVLLNRRVPVRQIEVATTEPERLQREVISRLAHDRHVKAVIVSSDPYSGVDNVPNWERVPLIWKWIQANFEPDFAEGKLVIWKRRV